MVLYAVLTVVCNNMFPKVPSQWDNSPAGGKAAYWAAMPDEEPRSPQAGHSI